MKNTNHTPGPWRIVCASAHEFNPDTLRKDIIGKCQFGDAYVAGDISINDAHLIASAPDLLSALIALEKASRKVLDTSATHDGLENCKTLLEARIAIQKAKGEA